MNKKLKIDPFKKGTRFAIPIKEYAKAKNFYLKELNNKEGNYSKKQIQKDLLNNKGARPVIVLWSNKNFDKILVCSTTTTDNDFNKRHNYKNNDYPANSKKIEYWKYETLILDKKNTTIVNNHIWYHYNNKKMNDFFDKYRNSKFKEINISNNYFKNKVNEFEQEMKLKRNKEKTLIN